MTLVPVISISTALTTLINLFRYLFNSSYASVLSKKRTKIISFIEYDILIVFTNYSIPLIRLIFIFNFSIKSVFNILFDFPYFIINVLIHDLRFLYLCFFYRHFFSLDCFSLVLVLLGVLTAVIFT